MSTPSIKVGQGNWGIKVGNLLGYANTDKKFVAREFTVGRLLNTATRVNASGNIEVVNANVPRIDYFGGQASLLVEPSAQNLALRSAGFEVSGTWAPTNTSITTGTTAAFTAPDNSTDADLLTATTSGSSFVGQSIAIASGTYTISVFAKAGTSQILSLGNVSRNLRGAWFNLNAGAVTGTVNGGTASMQNYGNGWYRCIYTSSGMVSGTNALIVGLADAANALTATIGTNLYVWGAQLETGSVATSHIPTTTGTASRSADVISVSGAVSGSIGQTAGTIYCEFAFLGTPTTRSGPIFLRQADSRGMSINFAPTDSPSGIRFSSRNNAGTTSLNIVSGALQVGTFYKVAIAYDAAGTAAGGTQASGVVAYVNGSQVAIGTFQVPDAAGLTQFRMYGANSGSDTEAFNGRIRSAALYTTRLTNAELATLTQS